ncbi:DUF2550 domain-containing protein [Angustibacter aerolatus]
MHDLLVPLEVVGALALLLVLAMAFVASRRRWLRHAPGTFDCSLRTTTESQLGKGWQLGVARYEQDRIAWYRVFDVSPRPRRVLQRPTLMVQQRRLPSGPEAFAVMPGSVILRCRDDARVIELAMSDQSSTGFASWLEAAPPGQNVSVA